MCVYACMYLCTHVGYLCLHLCVYAHVRAHAFLCVQMYTGRPIRSVCVCVTAKSVNLDGRTIVEKLKIACLEGPLPCFHKYAIWYYFEPEESNLHFRTIFRSTQFISYSRFNACRWIFIHC